jgi:phosphoribosylformylglycinamidine synthase PurS subunit
MKATVYVTIKQNVLDPQGSAVQGALHSMGFDEVGKVRIGKYLELDLNTTDRAAAE